MSTLFEIPSTEYEQRRHIFELCRWINEVLARMEARDDFEKLYFEHTGTNVKKLLEEAVPIAYVGLHVFRFFHDVFVTCYAQGHPIDGELELVGPNAKQMRLEVTTMETNDSTMRRQAISRHGFVWMYGPIHRKGRDIVSTPEMVDVTEREDQLVDLAFERFLAKAESGRYSSDTAIIVTSTVQVAPAIRQRGELLRRTRRWLRDHPDTVLGAYYCYPRDRIVDSATASGSGGL